MSNFLENLKKAADTGEFNSDAAKKILEINELADKKLGGGTVDDLERLKEKLNERVAETEETKSAPAEPEAISEEDLTEKLDELVEEVKETKAVEAVPPKPKVGEEEVVELNSKYERQMATIKLVDSVNAQLAMLVEIEDMVELTIQDMFGHIDDLEKRFGLEFEKENPIFGDLYLKIEEIKSKYKS